MKELRTKAEVQSSYPVMAELCGHLSEKEYVQRVADMQGDGYRLFGLYEREELVSLAGVAIRMDLFNGRHLWVYELVTAGKHRSKGYGHVLVQQLEEFASENGCSKVVLYSGMSRIDAHRFWEEQGMYEKRGYVFKKELV
ncbi:GNAT family N-acetyltransferase [Ectobacillus ponti]|uniref:GNAT family N-acetyltransferase n=1 Tax=Ectobacillus ponti TaxID=2961894 RepID=A0AA41XBV8_9BACI|nr:GNAT family N-acetyltransferase [Ectobacillus ponti]MCP8970595.1 GNAT family N-acetyltransferase [Ectobacillus ponti]